ncbi:MAG: hypothetical protein KDB35_20090 [Acidimicrobiales bacterium]|nr:hypothetical protein [Acidimicrobiales bacterium]MCB1249974.1 hypothetical protein [Acidimicrobiales bacterium]MCB1261859.1 hypothetical protein [Acidimicrobiales bacterium]
MDEQLPLIDGPGAGADTGAPVAWHLADDVRRRGLDGVSQARRALEAARRRRLGAVGDAPAPDRQAA